MQNHKRTYQTSFHPEKYTKINAQPITQVLRAQNKITSQNELIVRGIMLDKFHHNPYQHIKNALELDDDLKNIRQLCIYF